MKRTLSFILSGLLLFSLAACGSGDKQADTAKPESAQTAGGSVKVEGSTITITDDGSGKAVDENGMKKEPIVTNKSIEASGQIGPIKFTITSAQLSKATVTNEQAAALMRVEEGQEFAIVGIGMDVENTVDDEIDFFPNQGTIVTNTKEQVDAALFLSEDIGGKFLGKVKKSGQTYFICKNSVADDITSIKFHVNGPLNIKTGEASDAMNIEINFNR